MERKHGFLLIAVYAAYAFLLILVFYTRANSSSPPNKSENQMDDMFIESELLLMPPSDHVIPRLAYLISGSKGDLDRLWRTLQAFYHPANQYIVHLDLEASAAERLELVMRVEKEPIFAKVGNVHTMPKANLVTYRGPTMITNTLQAMAILLNRSKEWDWFVNLSASDYPLVTQDDILYAFSYLPRNLNFIEHSSNLGWKEVRRGKPIIIDPGLYVSIKSDIVSVTQTRELPTSFRLNVGGKEDMPKRSNTKTSCSAWMALSRAFVEYSVWGWDSLPRTMLMYHANFLSSPESYFQTLICNTPEFAPTAVNHDLHYISWDVPPRQHPHTLGSKDVARMVGSRAPFARKFNHNDPVLDMIDARLLGRRNGSFSPGGWCSGSPPCSATRESYRLRPGPGAMRLASLIDGVVRSGWYVENQCKLRSKSA